MRWWNSSSLGVSLASAISACTLVPNPALEGGESTSDADTSTSDADTSTGAFEGPPSAPALGLTYSPIKRFDFSWADVPEASSYQLLERAAPGEPWVQLGGDLAAGEVAVSWEMPLYERQQASYVLRACNTAGCEDSAEAAVMGSLAGAVGYVKASNTDAGDLFRGVTLSGDGNTLAVGAPGEASNATGINGGNSADNSAANAGAVYVFVRNGLGTWLQQAYIKASNTDMSDFFGAAVALSGDGNTLAVGAFGEASNATSIDGDEDNNDAGGAGAVYVFVRDDAGTWVQQAYIKASNTNMSDFFGAAVALSTDGNTLAVGAYLEGSGSSGAVYVFVRDGAGTWSQQEYIKASTTNVSIELGIDVELSGDGNTLAVGASGDDSNATAIGGDQDDNNAIEAGAVYVFVRDGAGTWSEQEYIKASNTDALDEFGVDVGLSGDGNTLAVGAHLEDGNATGIGGDEANDAALEAGAVYVFVRDGAGTWSQQAYIKASNTDADDQFGGIVELSGDGNTLAVGAHLEDGNATGIDGDEASNAALEAGAVYLFVREGAGTWSQQAYIKASNTDAADHFGVRLTLDDDGSTLAVGAPGESSNATGVGGDQSNDSAPNAGAVYLY